MDFLFHLATEIGGMTAGELGDRMSVDEFACWGAWLKQRSDREKKAHEKARREAKTRR